MISLIFKICFGIIVCNYELTFNVGIDSLKNARGNFCDVHACEGNDDYFGTPCIKPGHCICEKFSKQTLTQE